MYVCTKNEIHAFFHLASLYILCVSFSLTSPPWVHNNLSSGPHPWAGLLSGLPRVLSSGPPAGGKVGEDALPRYALGASVPSEVVSGGTPTRTYMRTVMEVSSGWRKWRIANRAYGSRHKGKAAKGWAEYGTSIRARQMNLREEAFKTRREHLLTGHPGLEHSPRAASQCWPPLCCYWFASGNLRS